MSTDIDYSKTPTPGGGALFVVGYDDEDAWQHVGQKLASQTETPTPSTDSDRDGGPVTRFNEVFSALGGTAYEAIGLDGYEIANAIRTRRDELFRNEFPLLRPRFALRCEECGAEYGEEVSECEVCGSTDLAPPSVEQKRRAEQLFKRVNKEGQSLRDVAKLCEDDQWRLGVPVIVITYDYTVAREDTALWEQGTVVRREPEEILRGDAKRIVPVVDEDGRIGGHWWVCPIHRDTHRTSPGECEHCGAELREVYFAETASARHAGDDAEKYFLEHEVLTYPYAFPRLHGLDGLSPVHHVWLKQAILEFMDQYAGAYYDPDSDRLPNKIGILHTSNPDAWEDRLSEARERASDDPYESPFYTNEVAPESRFQPELQMIDVMPEDLLGQNAQMKKDFKSDIRQAFGITDVYDSELEDAGGLNNEGLQLEVTDRSIASQQHDYVEGWLLDLCNRLDITDWYIAFVPSRQQETDELQSQIKTGAMADKAGLTATLEDGEATIQDGEFDVVDADVGQTPGATGGDGLGSFAPDDEDRADDADQRDAVGQKARPGDVDPVEACEVLMDAHRHIVWADSAERKAEPFFSKDDSVPEFVLELVQEALDRNPLYKSIDGIDLGDRGALAEFFGEKLTQPQGWSLESLASDIADRFDVDYEQAEDIARNETKAINDTAREIGYERAGDLDDRRFKHIGPADDKKHEACWWLLSETNPEFGGSPVSLEKYKQLVQEANDRFVDGHDARAYSPHIGCRDSYVEVYD